jgi:hypothetical protein
VGLGPEQGTAMSKWYRRMQLISTVVVLFPSAVLLYFGYLSATTPGHSTTEAIVLFVLGAALPPLIYSAWAGVLWAKRGQLPGADPSSPAARYGKYLPYLAVGVMVALISLGRGFTPAPARSDEKGDGFVKMRASCVAEAGNGARRQGVDPDAAETKARIEKYCTCYVLQVQLQYTPEEFAQLSKLDRAALAKEKKLGALLETCDRQATQP